MERNRSGCLILNDFVDKVLMKKSRCTTVYVIFIFVDGKSQTKKCVPEFTEFFKDFLILSQPRYFA